MPTDATYNEHDLLQRIALGEAVAFETVYHHYQDAVRQFVSGLVKSSELAEDLTQEIFILIWDKRLLLTEVHSFRAYLFIMARNHSLNCLKRAASLIEAKAALSRQYVQVKNEPEDNLLLKDYMQYLQEQLDALSPRAREVFMLCRQQHKSYDEVAALLGITRDAVKKHMVLSMKTLKAAVEKDLGISFTVLLLALSHPVDYF